MHGAISEIAERFTGRCVAIVAHLGVIDALLPGNLIANAEVRRASAREIIAAAPKAAGALRP